MEKTAIHINKRRDVFLEINSKNGGSWIKITKKQLYAIVKQVEDKDYITFNYNLQDLGK